MSGEYFFTASSDEFMLAMNLFDRDVKDELYLNVTFNYGSSRQTLECESLGYWLNLSDISKFQDDVAKNKFDVSLVDTEGVNLFTLSKSESKTVLTHCSRTEGDPSSLDKFFIRFEVSNSFLEELIEGLREAQVNLVDQSES